MINLEAASLTDTGQLREENEDSAWSQIYRAQDKPPLGLFVVCDGMGGHMGGKYASYWAVEAIKQEFADLFVAKDPRATLILTKEDIKKAKAGILITPQPPPEPDLREVLRTAVQKANKVVYDFAAHKPDQAGNAGTTVTMAVLRGGSGFVANCGDSRTYLIRDHEVIQITRDHSLVAHMIAEGSILPSEIYTHPQRNIIYRYLGERGNVTADIYPIELQAGDYLLLCSDGLWEMIQNEYEISYLVESSLNLEQACERLVEAANKAGGEDNISVVIIKAT